jgi:hypothetical protein
MKRTFATTTFAFAILGVAACKGGAGDAAKFIPDGANGAMGVDVASLQKSKIWTDNLKAKYEAENKDQIAAMSECKLGIDKIKSVTVGADVNSGGAKMAAVVSGEGIGNKANLECMHGKLKEKMGGNDPWTAEEDGKVLKNAMGEGNVVYVIDDNKIVYASKDWADAVGKLTKGEGKNAFDGSLKDLVGRTDTGKQIWFAGALPEQVGGMASAQLGATPKDVAGWADLSGDVSVKVAVGLASSDEANSTKEKVEALWGGFKALAKDQAGMSDGAIESVKFGTDGSAVTVEATIPEADVTEAMKKLPM